MIDIGTELQPRNADTDPVVRVVGVAEPDRYVVQPVEFASPFALDFDEIAAAYVCDGHKVQIVHESEQEAWAKLSAKTLNKRFVLAGRKHAQELAESLPSPEEYLAKYGSGPTPATAVAASQIPHDADEPTVIGL